MKGFSRFATSLAVLLLLGLAVPADVAHGQAPTQLQSVSPFEAIGFIQKATLDPACTTDIFCGGTLVVNGLTITVPRNTLFQFPATNMTWQEMFKLAPDPYGLGAPGGPQSGLALSDNPKPLTTYEVTVVGNRVIRSATDDKYVAALIFLSQHALNAGAGFINAIDYSTGEMWVGSTLQARTGARLRLNTPKGRYGKQDPIADQRFTSDEDNPTIHAESGYPLCLPRTDPAVADDPLCPQRNRPRDPMTGVYQTIFTMPRSPLTDPPGPPLGPNDPDATQMAPFEVGDYIDYAGTLTRIPGCTPTATDLCQYISVHTITANLAIWTAPATMPAYVSVEAFLLGVGGTPNPLFPQEAVERLTMVGFTTDPTQLIDVYAVDVDACGAESSRFYASADASGPPGRRAKKGRGVVRTFFGDYLPPTRDVRIASRTFTRGRPIDQVLETAKTYANGLLAGQYRLPNFDFITPEAMILGMPPVPAPYEEFPFLANGSGPYFGSGSNARTTPYGNLGQLDPWPGQAAPTPLSCGPAGLLKAPVVNAGPTQTVSSGVRVVLDGTASSDANNPPLPLSYTWLQTGGPTVDLQNDGFARPFFTAPSVPAGGPSVVLTFSLVVGNGFSHSAVSSVSVLVVGGQTPVVNAGPSQTVNGGAAVTLTGSASDPNGPAGQPLTFQWIQTDGPTVALTGANTATPSFTAPTMAVGQAAATLTFRLTVTNGLGVGSSSITSVAVRPIPDTVTITLSLWRQRKSILRVDAVSSVTNGQPVLTLHVPGKPDVQLHLDPLSNAPGVYTTGPEAYVVNPAPSTVTVTSSFGGSASAPVIIRR